MIVSFLKEQIKKNRYLYSVFFYFYKITLFPQASYRIFKQDFKTYRILGAFLTSKLIGYKIIMLLLPYRPGQFFNNRKHKIILDFIQDHFNIIDNDNVPKIESNPYPEKIWVCWFQGEQCAPDLIKVCLNRIRKYANNHEVILITKDNYNKYVDVPNSFLDKLKKGNMLYAHISDYIRYQLLFKYGGLWIDSTVFVNKPIGSNNEYSYDIFSIHFACPLEDSCIARSRWMTPVIGCKAGNGLIYNIYKIFEEYNYKFNHCIDYLLIDYIMDYIVSSDSYYKKQIDKIPYSNSGFQLLAKQLGNVFNSDNYNKILSSNTTYFKLTYKSTAKLYKDGQPTFLRHILFDSNKE